MDTGTVFIVGLFAYLIISQVVSGRSSGGRKALATQEALKGQFQGLETTLTEIRDRLVAIEGILQQVE